MALRQRLPAGPPTAFRYSTILGIPGPPGAKGTDGSGSAWVAGTDLAGSTSSQVVIGIAGNPLLGSPTNGDTLVYHSSDGKFHFQPGMTPAGDLSGSAATQTVIGLIGHLINGTPSNGDSLVYNSGTGKFDFHPGFTAGGDLAGTSTSQEVIGLINHLISGTPNNGDSLVYDSGTGHFVFRPGSDFPAPWTVLVSNTTLTTTDTWKEFGQGPYTISLPATPVTGRTIELLHVSGDLSGGGLVTVSNNGGGYNIEDPQNRFGHQATTVNLTTNEMTYRFRYNGSIMRCVS